MVENNSSTRDETRSIKITLAGYAVVILLQVGAYSATHILVILAGAFDTLSDIFISGFLLLAIYISRKPPDESHMLGHGRAQNVAALIAASFFIFFLSFEMFREALSEFLQPQASAYENLPLALGVTVIALIATTIPFLDIIRIEKRGAALTAQLIALAEMEVAYITTLVTIVLLSRGYTFLDPIISLLIAIFIAISGLYLIRDNIGYLMGHAPPREFFEQVRAIALSEEGVLGVHEIVAEYGGPNIINMGLHIEVKGGTPIEEADRIARNVKRRIMREAGCSYCIIHVDPVGTG